jgi:hypothetical protein
MSAETLQAFREETRANAETLAELDAELKPFFAEELELVRAIVRTYPHRIGEDKFGGPVPIVTSYSPITEQRMELRARLDAIRIETAPLRRERAERHRLRGWYTDRIMELSRPEPAQRRSFEKQPKPRKTKHDDQPKLL